MKSGRIQRQVGCNASRPVQAAIVHALQEAREGTDKEMRKTVLFNTIVFVVD